MSNNNNNNNNINSAGERKKNLKIKAFIKSAMSKYGKIQKCTPYGMSVTCICDTRGRIFHCMFPGIDHSDDDLTGEAMLSRDDRGDGGLNGLGNSDDMSSLDMASASHGRGLDEKTEIILAATFLVLIILAFISFVIYRCEKSYMRRRLQESFHMSPSTGGLVKLCNGGLMGGLTGNGHSVQIPTISVSVQTEPQMLSTFGLANTAALLTNGGLQHQMNGNGHAGSTMNGNQAPISISGHSYSNYSSTLPHLGGHLSTHHFAALNTPGLGNGGGCLSGNGGLNHQDLCEDALDGVGPGTGGGHRHSLWSRDNLHATSYRDMREIIAMPTQQTSGSRDNTLSRDMHLINDRENGMRTSGTTENLRSPSVTGTNGRDDDEINTEYAESDVMISNDRPNNNTNSGSSNESCGQQQRYIP